MADTPMAAIAGNGVYIRHEALHGRYATVKNDCYLNNSVDILDTCLLQCCIKNSTFHYKNIV